MTDRKKLREAAERAADPQARVASVYVVPEFLALCKPETILALLDDLDRKTVGEVVARRGFPVLGEGQTIDFALVADHGKQAEANHYQTVERLAERGGLSWCELYAVLHNKRWEQMDQNEAMIACRALEARYLEAVSPATALAERDKRIAELERELFEARKMQRWDAAYGRS